MLMEQQACYVGTDIENGFECVKVLRDLGRVQHRVSRFLCSIRLTEASCFDDDTVPAEAALAGQEWTVRICQGRTKPGARREGVWRVSLDIRRVSFASISLRNAGGFGTCARRLFFASFSL